MLREDQAAELLRRCEEIAGERLEKVRGNLRKAQTRAAAIWELLVLEEASRIGKVSYEPHPESSPDILLELPQSEKIWIEVAFLYPRFWKEERSSGIVGNWIREAAEKRGISKYKIYCRFDGDQKNAAGPVRSLPNLHEKKDFLKNPELKSFFEAIRRNPDQKFSWQHSGYSVAAEYFPERKGPYIIEGGLSQEVPKTVKEHALYRVLKEKARQHKVQEPRVICVGSDQSQVLSDILNTGNATVKEAVASAFNQCRSLSGAIVLRIEDTNDTSRYTRRARGQIFVNPDATSPLSIYAVEKLSRLNFNRWRYFFRLPRYEKGCNEAFRRVCGDFKLRIGERKMIIEVPENILVDALAGKTNLIERLELKEDDPIYHCLNKGWVITSCEMKEGNVEAGEAAKVVLELSPPPEPVFWPDKKGA